MLNAAELNLAKLFRYSSPISNLKKKYFQVVSKPEISFKINCKHLSCTRSEYFLSGTCRRAEGETYIYYPLVYNSKCKFKEKKIAIKKKKLCQIQCLKVTVYKWYPNKQS